MTRSGHGKNTADLTTNLRSTWGDRIAFMIMDVASILKRNSIRCASNAASKKQALELLSQSLAEATGTVNPGEVLEGLAGRERLGSTGLGEAIAMPHARLPGIDKSVGAFLKLTEPVDFDSTDGKPVDLLFGLLVPQECSTEVAKDIRELVTKLKDPALQQGLRATDDPDELHSLLTNNRTVDRRPAGSR